MSGFPERLEIPARHWQVIAGHLTACLPEEGCGLAGGLLAEGTAQVQETRPIENALHSPVRFRMAPEAQLKAFYAFEEHGLELVAIFHSHPAGPDHPSATDTAEFAYPGTLTLICVPTAGGEGWSARAFKIEGGQVAEVDCQIT